MLSHLLEVENGPMCKNNEVENGHLVQNATYCTECYHAFSPCVFCCTECWLSHTHLVVQNALKMDVKSRALNSKKISLNLFCPFLGRESPKSEDLQGPLMGVPGGTALVVLVTIDAYS